MTFVLDFRSADRGGFVTRGEITDTARREGRPKAEETLATADSVTFLIHG